MNEVNFIIEQWDSLTSKGVPDVTAYKMALGRWKCSYLIQCRKSKAKPYWHKKLLKKRMRYIENKIDRELEK